MRYLIMLNYIDRSLQYYSELGYARYKWSQFTDVPFTPLKAPIVDSRITLISTAGPHVPTAGAQGPGADYNAKAKFFKAITLPKAPTPDLRISHLSYDRKHCMADDSRTWLPMQSLQRAKQNSLIGEITGEVICLPTNRSQRVSIQQDCLEVVGHCLRLKTDVALLVPT